jgi:glycosyltransferase involved in cell wall biosynthesis
MNVLVAHPGTQHAPRLARELAARGLLDGFWTGVGFSAGSTGGRLALAASRLPGLRGLASRVLPGIPAAKIHARPALETRALLRLRRHETQEVIHERNLAFQESIPDAALRHADAVIGFDTSSWVLARRLAALGRRLFLDRTIAHPQVHDRIMREVAARFPAWDATVERRLPALAEAEQVEHDLAHRIVAGSPFVAQTLRENGVPAEKIRVNPYGVDWARFAPLPGMAAGARPLRFLFAGSITARKGVPLLLEAWRALGAKDAELWLAGRAGEQVRRLIPDLPGLCVLGQVSQRDMPVLYAQCDVFVLPTYFEGFSLVVLEALAAGLPVITTPNSGAEDVITRPSLGRLVTAGHAEELIDALRTCTLNPPCRAEVINAVRELRPQLSWESYGDRWSQLLRETN